MPRPRADHADVAAARRIHILSRGFLRRHLPNVALLGIRRILDRDLKSSREVLHTLLGSVSESTTLVGRLGLELLQRTGAANSQMVRYCRKVLACTVGNHSSPDRIVLQLEIALIFMKDSQWELAHDHLLTCLQEDAHRREHVFSGYAAVVTLALACNAFRQYIRLRHAITAEQHQAPSAMDLHTVHAPQPPADQAEQRQQRQKMHELLGQGRAWLIEAFQHACVALSVAPNCDAYLAYVMHLYELQRASFASFVKAHVADDIKSPPLPAAVPHGGGQAQTHDDIAQSNPPHMNTRASKRKRADPPAYVDGKEHVDGEESTSSGHLIIGIQSAQVRQVLSEFASRNPSNPNAWRWWIVFLTGNEQEGMTSFAHSDAVADASAPADRHAHSRARSATEATPPTEDRMHESALVTAVQHLLACDPVCAEGWTRLLQLFERRQIDPEAVVDAALSRLDFLHWDVHSWVVLIEAWHRSPVPVRSTLHRRHALRWQWWKQSENHFGSSAMVPTSDVEALLLTYRALACMACTPSPHAHEYLMRVKSALSTAKPAREDLLQLLAQAVATATPVSGTAP